MNVLDSELAASGLTQVGLVPADRRRDADVILFNTCSIRQHAEDKIYSALGRLKHWKTHRPGGVLGVLGCLAQKDQATIFRRAPHVDLVLGPGRLDRLPETVCRLLDEKRRGVATKPVLLVSLTRSEYRHDEVLDSFPLYDPLRDPRSRPNPFQAMVRIMLGCDKFCAYCIVPSVRGPEQSRSPGEILAEIRALVDQGVLEITLIGQTVNSYRFQEGERTTRLSDLLARASDIEGLRRIRFATNYPRGMDDDLLAAVRDLPKIMKHLHVPVQSGSDAVLRRMRRRYTVAEYRELIDRVRETIPGTSMTSDFIVGFCGETDDEFGETVELVRYGRFKNGFVFKYSERPGTGAAEHYSDDVPEAVKKARNNELLAVQDGISRELNDRFIGRDVEILVDGVARRYEKGVQLSGRTSCDRIVVFDAPDESLLGRFLTLSVDAAAPFTLFARLKGSE